MSKVSFHHGQAAKTGVLITNLGTPDNPDRKSVRRYLKEFLWDSRVVEVPRPIWWFILNVVILNTRPQKSALAYQQVWTPQGSPLLTISQEQVHSVRQQLQASREDLVIELAMRYGNPSISTTLESMRQAGVTRILLLPLYPQYSATTTASTFDAVSQAFSDWRWLPELRTINHYHDRPEYISALAVSIKQHWTTHGRAEKLIMSFHGIPQDYLLKGDPYHCECHKTARLLANELDLEPDQWQLTFQSRLGPKKWLQPYTDQTMAALPKQGCKSVQVVCPGFSADCLETLEEVAVENRDIFLQAGGERYEYIQCLNANNEHIDMLCGLVNQHLQGWTEIEDADELKASQQRAHAMGSTL